MPPKKKIVEENAEDPDRSLLSVEDFNLPKSMILRLTKGVLPPNTSVQKDALTAILKSTTLFVNYLASNADDRAQLANKKTIRPEDVFGALEEIEFGHFRARVEQELSKYQEIQNHKRNDYRRRMKEDPKPAEAGAGDGNENEDGETISDSTRDKSTTPLVVTLGNGDRDRERDRSSLRYGLGRDDTETEADDEPPAAKKVRRSLADDGTNGRDEDDTLSDVDDNDDAQEEDEDELLDDDEDVEVEDEVVDDEDPEELGGLTDVDSDKDATVRRQNGADGLNPNPDDDDDDDDNSEPE